MIGKKVTLRLASTFGIITSSLIMLAAIMSATGFITLADEPPKMMCSFHNYDGSYLYSTHVRKYDDAIYRGPLPTKEREGNQEYRFVGWDKSLKRIAADTNFYAQFEMLELEYTATFVNYDGEILYVDEVESGGIPVYLGETPQKPSDKEHSYQFIDWDQPLAPIYQNTTFRAVYRENQRLFTVNFYNYDGKLLASKQTPFNGTATYDGTTPTRPSENLKVYTFKKWAPEPFGITRNTDVFAIYDEITVDYRVTFVNYDDTQLYVDSVIKGQTATYPLPNPTRPDDGEYVYTFIGWDKSLENIQSHMTIKALYDRNRPDLLVTFLNYDQSLLDQQKVPFGETAVYDGPTPVKESDNQYTYQFKGWDRKLENVTSSFTTIAQYDSTLQSFDVVYANYDSQVLQTLTVPYGSPAIYTGALPTRETDSYYEYVFKGWSYSEERLSSVKENIFAIAEFDTIPLEQPPQGETGDNNNGGGSGDSDSGGSDGSGMLDFYIVKFRNWNQDLLARDGVLKSNRAYYEGPTPTRHPDENYSYVFQNFDKSLENVQKSLVTYAQYQADDGLVYKYIVTFRNADGSLLYEDILDYGEKPEFNGQEAPVRPEGFSKDAKFIGWDRSLAPATESYTVYAEYLDLASPGGGGNGPIEDGTGGTGGGAGGGSTSGNLSGEGPGELSSQKVFSYHTNYAGSIYLRELSYSDLGNNQWKAPKPYDIPSDGLSPLYFTSDKLKVSGANTYSLTLNYEADHQYSIVPSFVQNQPLTNNDAFASQYAFGYIEQFQREVGYDFMPFRLTRTNYQEIKTKAYSSPSIRDHEFNYRNYVRDNYLSMPELEKQYIEQFIVDNQLKAESMNDIFNTLEFVSKYATYNINFEAYPDDASYLIYFLDQAKEGICNHFASAFTAIMRSLGVPARYVTGYLSSSPGQDTVTTVAAKQAHAWAEIYLDDLGWVTMDPTPASSGGEGSGDGGEGGDFYFGGSPFGEFQEGNPIENLIVINIHAEFSSKTYDGAPMAIIGNYVGSLEEGHVIDYGIIEGEIDAGKYTARARPRILDQDGNDVSSSYRGRVMIFMYTYEITPLVIQITTASASKARDGTALIAHEFTINQALPPGHVVSFTFVGSQTKRGSSLNIVDINSLKIVDQKGVDQRHNYIVMWVYGSLTVT